MWRKYDKYRKNDLFFIICFYYEKLRGNILGRKRDVLYFVGRMQTAIPTASHRVEGGGEREGQGGLNFPLSVPCTLGSRRLPHSVVPAPVYFFFCKKIVQCCKIYSISHGSYPLDIPSPTSSCRLSSPITPGFPPPCPPSHVIVALWEPIHYLGNRHGRTVSPTSIKTRLDTGLGSTAEMKACMPDCIVWQLFVAQGDST